MALPLRTDCTTQPLPSRSWLKMPISLLNIGLLLLALCTGSLGVSVALRPTKWLLRSEHVALVFALAAVLTLAFIVGLGAPRSASTARLYFACVLLLLAMHVVHAAMLVNFNRNVRNKDADVIALLTSRWNALPNTAEVEKRMSCSTLRDGDHPCLDALLSEARTQGRLFISVFCISSWLMLALVILVVQLILPAKNYSERLVEIGRGYHVADAEAVPMQTMARRRP